MSFFNRLDGYRPANSLENSFATVVFHRISETFLEHLFYLTTINGHLWFVFSITWFLLTHSTYIYRGSIVQHAIAIENSAGSMFPHFFYKRVSLSSMIKEKYRKFRRNEKDSKIS